MPERDAFSSAWVGIHLPVEGNIYSTVADEVLMHSVFPIADSMMAENLIASYFFVRYVDSSGPHIRFRVRTRAHSPVSPTTVLGLLGECGVQHKSERPIVAVSYRPEVDRYGGSECIEAAENYFAASSHFVRRALTESSFSLRGQRLSCALLAMLRFVQSCTREVGEAALLLDAYARSIGGQYSEALPTGGPLAYGLQQRVRDLALSEMKFSNAGLPTSNLSWVREFEAASRRYALELQARVAQTSRPINREPITRLPISILCSQLHMTSNRFGITRDEETVLGSIASRALIDAGAAEHARSQEST